MSALQHSLSASMRLGSSAPCKHTVLLGNNLLVLPCCPLPARPLRSLHHSTTAMGRRGLAELINVGKQRRCAGTAQSTALQTLRAKTSQTTQPCEHFSVPIESTFLHNLLLHCQGSWPRAVEAWSAITHIGSARTHTTTAICWDRSKSLDRIYPSTQQRGGHTSI